MNEKKQYCGLDLLKFIMAVLVAARHMIQVFYPAESRWRLIIGSWLSRCFSSLRDFFYFARSRIRTKRADGLWWGVMPGAL